MSAATPSEVAGLVAVISSYMGSAIGGVSSVPLPATATTPYVTIQSIVATSLESLSGPSGLKRTLMQINVYSPSYEVAFNTREQIRGYLQGFQGATGNGRTIASPANHGDRFGSGDAELYDNTRGLHQLISRLLIWWQA